MNFLFRRTMIISFTLLAVVFLTLFLSVRLTTRAASSTVSSSSCALWSSVAPNNNNKSNNNFLGTTAISPSDVWAVGNRDASILIQHWNGVKWSVVKSPKTTGLLNSVTAISSQDVWAVGFLSFPNGARKVLTEHWNGSIWTYVSSPTPGGSNTLSSVSLNSVSGDATNDVWAVGTYTLNQQNDAFIEHWNGTTWSIVTTPSLSTNATFKGVTAIATNDAWAVGNTTDNSGNSQALTEHWNGTSWNTVNNPVLAGSSLNGVSASATNDVWAAGSAAKGTQRLIEQWNGTSWSVVPSPSQGLHSNVLNAISVESASNVWAIGYFFDYSNNVILDVAEQWNGKKWSTTVIPSNGNGDSELNGVVTVPGTHQVWAVGTGKETSGRYLAFTYVYC